MATFLSWKTAAVFGGVMASLMSLTYVIPGLSYEQRRTLFVMQALIVAEFVMFMTSSCYIWKVVHAQFHPVSHISRDNVNCQFLAKSCIFVILLLSHYSLIARIVNNNLSYFNFCSFICLGLYVQFFICHLCISTSVGFMLWIMRKYSSFNLSRDKLTVQGLNFSIASVCAIILSVYGVHNAAQAPTVQNVGIPIIGLPQSMNNLSIVVISDIHIGPTVGKLQVDRIVNIVNRLSPDIVAVVGDLADGPVGELKSSVEPLKYIKAKRGKYFVTGNHEYYAGNVEEWFRHLESEFGFAVLHNSHVNISDKQGNYICLAGTDDIEGRSSRQPGHGMDLEKAVGSCERQRPIILLAHQPRAAKIALESGYNIQLVLSGHTHGGQMLPMTLIAYFANPFYAGLYKHGSGFVYVTQGSVYWGIPMRHFSNAEITHVLLQCSSSAAVY